MKQLIQNLKTGATEMIDIPIPVAEKGRLLIRTSCSLVSTGTERMLVEFGKANLLQKARQQPDKVKQVLDKIRSDGLMPTLQAVFTKLDAPLPLGYCNVGSIAATGDQQSVIGDLCTESNTPQPNSPITHQLSTIKPSTTNYQLPPFKTGARVVSNGPHAEYVCVPKNLCAAIPDNVTDEEAAFTVVGAISLQGIRLCGPTFGETIVVIGLGLIGLITVQILKANGCRVVGIDIDSEKLNLSKTWGVVAINPNASDGAAAVMQLTGGVGADGVIITASAKGDDIVSLAARMSRKRGRIILVGVVGLNINRAEFYEKELSFQVSCSYGPGRYDEAYEQKGQDYPIGFVRWTEKRNFEAVLQAISTGQLDVKSLITQRVKLKDYDQVYGNMGKPGAIASILVYPKDESSTNDTAFTKIVRTVRVTQKDFGGIKGTIGVVGAGNFTQMTVLPALKKCGASIRYISSANGLSGTHLAKKYGIADSTTDYLEILADPGVGLVMITTRHDLHAGMVVESLKAGKNVFVEKPLALNREELDAVRDAYRSGDSALTVGFNRRFSPHIQAIKKVLGDQPGPLNLTATMNAGAIPANVWVHDMETGGGRIIGEACHYLDLLMYLAQSPIEAVCMNAMGPNPKVNTDNVSILLRFENGSSGVVNYFANGHKGYSKERVEVYSQGRTMVMDNFRRTEAFGFSGFKGLKTAIDKGHLAQFKLLTDRLLNGGEALISFADIENVTMASFACIESMMRNAWAPV
jgi:predicted dehydrogenase/NADPH:quinone reductase-like Zn-dependent oxidoreductase